MATGCPSRKFGDSYWYLQLTMNRSHCLDSNASVNQRHSTMQSADWFKYNSDKRHTTKQTQDVHSAFEGH